MDVACDIFCPARGDCHWNGHRYETPVWSCKPLHMLFMFFGSSQFLQSGCSGITGHVVVWDLRDNLWFCRVLLSVSTQTVATRRWCGGPIADLLHSMPFVVCRSHHHVRTTCCATTHNGVLVVAVRYPRIASRCDIFGPTTTASTIIIGARHHYQRTTKVTTRLTKSTSVTNYGGTDTNA